MRNTSQIIGTMFALALLGSSATVFAQAPTIVSTSPTQNELNVPVSTSISVTFDTDMDLTTINDSTFVVNARSRGLYQDTITYHTLSGTLTADGYRDFAVGRLVPIDGYWLFRAPVYSADTLSGVSIARRYGPNLGNGRDVGVLWRADTPDDEGFLLQEEERYCGAWVQFFFDEPNIHAPGTIENIYCHTWMYMEDTELPIGEVLGFSIGENYNSWAYYDRINLTESPTWPHNTAYYNLVVYYCDSLDYGFQDISELWGASFKATGGYPQVLSYPNQRSFCIVNLDDTAALQTTDSDGDGLSDYDELFVTFTDPYDIDTDDDGHDDKQEHNNGKVGWDPYDWGTTYIYHPDGTNNRAYVQVLDDQAVEPQVHEVTDTLQRELTLQEYGRLLSYDHVYNSYPYTSDETHPWSMVQINLHYEIPHDISDIISINAFWGGVWISYDLVEGNTYKAIEIMNINGGGNERLRAKCGHTPVLYLKQMGGNFGDYVASDGMFYMRAYTKNRLSNAEVQLDFAEIWVVVGSSYILLTEPTEANPITVTGGQVIGVTFTFAEQDVEIISGVTVDSITINDVSCNLVGYAAYVTDHWEQGCVVPTLAAGSYYDLSMYAKTSTIMLTRTEANSVYAADTSYICGDVDGSGGNPNVADLTYFVDYLFFDGPPPPVMAAANVDGEGGINVADLTYLVDYLFFGGDEPDCQPIQ